MKIMIQWVTPSHSSMGFNLRPFENTFCQSEIWWLPWNVRAYFGALWLWLYHHAPVMAKVFGRLVSVCGSICKIDLCLDIFGPYNCWESYSVKKNCPRPPDPRFQIFSQFPDSRSFGLQFPDSRFVGPLFPDSRCWFTPPPPSSYRNFWAWHSELDYILKPLTI